MMMSEEYFWFRLWRTQGIGPKKLGKTYRCLKKNNLDPTTIPLDDPTKLKKEYPELASIIGNELTQSSSDDSIYEEYRAIKEERAAIIYPGHSDYPFNINEPKAYVLLCKGKIRLLKQPGVAIIGSRNASDEILETARKIANELACEGYNVVSGYARGVDTAAHLGALKAEGTTTMVLSYGILKFKLKPILRDYMHKDWVAVSQFPPQEPWTVGNAMARNELVCALSKAVIVIASGPEKDAKGRMSGTFAAAMAALRLDRKVFVVDPEYFGTTSQTEGNQELINKEGIIKFNPNNVIGEVIEKLNQDRREDIDLFFQP